MPSTIKHKTIFIYLILHIITSVNALATTSRNTMSMSASTPTTKRILVTGGNKGIGYAICKKLLEDYSDVHVLLGSRDVTRGEESIKSLQSSVSNSKDRLELVVLDTSSDESVQKAVETTAMESKSLYGIINNAGIGFGLGYHDTINTNYFGPRRICDAFAPFLMRPHGRIVNIASASGPNFISGCQDANLAEQLTSPLAFFKKSDDDTGIPVLDELAKSYSDKTDYGNEAYGVSKALLNAYTVLYAASNPDLIVNSCSPGYILTDMTRGMGASNAPEKGTKSPVHLMMSDDMKTLPTGRYYGSDAIRSPMHYYRGPGDPPYEGP